MAKIRRVRKRIRPVGLVGVIFTLTFALYLLSSIVLKSVNVSLNLQRQNYYNEIAKVQAANETASMQLQQLSAYDRVSTIAGSDLANDTANVVNITN